MSAREFLDWQLYDADEPLPDPWLQTGLLAALQFNANRKVGSAPKGPADFIPRREAGPDRSVAGQEAAQDAILGAFRALAGHRG